MVHLNAEQLAFWRALLAPFHPDELSVVPRRGGKGELTYIDKRALENRLDTVCGPHGWFPEYDATNRGYKCRLNILVPMGNGAWVWMHKEDGAGFEEMGSYNKQTNEWEADVDNDEKSGYTNALRRAAQDAWGIGRYLYNKGIPAWLDPNASHEDAIRPQPSPAEVNPLHAEAHEAMSAPRESAQAPSPAEAFGIPKAGKAVYAWCKGMETHFKTKLVDGMRDGAQVRGLKPAEFFAWDQPSVDAICLEAIAFIKSLPTYKGEFDHFDTTPPEPTPVSDTSAPASNELAEAKKELATKLAALVERHVGRKPNTRELSDAFGNIACECKNGQGHLGEHPDSLKTLTDLVWIKNIIALVDDQLRQAASTAGDDDIPF
jgi:hypothetical protein